MHSSAQLTFSTLKKTMVSCQRNGPFHSLYIFTPIMKITHRRVLNPTLYRQPLSETFFPNDFMLYPGDKNFHGNPTTYAFTMYTYHFTP